LRAAAALPDFFLMKSTPVICVAAAALLALGGAWWLRAREAPRQPWLEVTLSPPVHTSAPEPAPTAAPVAPDPHQHSAMLALEVERALAAHDPQQRETAFAFLLPELLQMDAPRVVDLVARQEPGEARDSLRSEVARQWIARDRDAAIQWMKSFESPGERQASASVAVQSLAAVAPGQAVEVADQFGIGRDDGSLEHLVQIWAEDDLDAATRWIERQPPGVGTEQLRTRIEQVRASRDASAENR
jgi:hypothetical protein